MAHDKSDLLPSEWSYSLRWKRLIDSNANVAQHCIMGTNAFDYIPGPVNGKTPVAPVLSMNWRCTKCAMHFAFGHLTSAPDKCERCGSKVLDPY